MMVSPPVLVRANSDPSLSLIERHSVNWIVTIRKVRTIRRGPNVRMYNLEPMSWAGPDLVARYYLDLWLILLADWKRLDYGQTAGMATQ